MAKLYLFSKTIHRYLVIIISFLTIIMAGTGIVLKYPSFFFALNMDINLFRLIHSGFSVIFSIVLLLMIISGIIMYIFPFMRKKPS